MSVLGYPPRPPGPRVADVLTSAVELIASIQADAPRLIPSDQKESVILALRALGRCAYFLADDLEGKGRGNYERR
jgi:hypothetical protein